MPLTGGKKTIVQCDFDGTITEEDASFMILDAFASGTWRQLFRDYQECKITVGHFNTEAFSTVKADRESLLGVVRGKVTVRPGFPELVACCRRKGFRFVIVSNGLDFYIDEILRGIRMADIEVFAAQTRFYPDGLKVQYIGPDGNYLDSDFKLAYVNLFLNEGYRVIYIGDGASDISPARKSHYVFAFATGTLLKHCKEANLDCVSFTNFDEVVKVLESWQ
jgi:2-hydroxy-3-keto-5-methylthiopentenyl-1-phosphate phosphatase